jgi:hypothetical protein
MMLLFNSRRIMLILCLAAAPLLVGSSCAFIFSSGGGSSDRDKDTDDDDTTVIVKSGSFGAPPVAGVSYETGSLEGVTGNNGEFQYEEGEAIRFFIGRIDLGTAAQAKAIMTPQDLVADDAPGSPEAVNIARLLKSLDSDPADEIITIPTEVRAAALPANDGLSAAIEFLDFSDDAVFNNTASQLVAVLTQDYPFTAVLVEADDPRERKIKSIAAEPQ